MSNYTASDIQAHTDLETVRANPQVYLGTRPLYQGVLEILSNSLDEAIAGYASAISVQVIDDYTIRISDNGRGVPFEMTVDKNGQPISALVLAFSSLNAGGKFRSDKKGGGYSNIATGGTFGVGASVVCFLSDYFSVITKRQGISVGFEARNGIICNGPVKINDTIETGTEVTFRLDPTMFYDEESRRIEPVLIRNLCKEMALLNPGIKVSFGSEVFSFSDIKTYMSEYLKANSYAAKSSIIIFEGEQEQYKNEDGSEENVQATVILAWCDGVGGEQIQTYVNSIHMPNNGVHVTGLKTSITNTVVKSEVLKPKNQRTKKEYKGDDVRNGMVAVCILKLSRPLFQDLTKTSITNKTAQSYINSLVGKNLKEHLEKTPKDVSVIRRFANEAYKTRLSIEKVTSQSSGEKMLTASKYLTRANSKNPKEKVLFIVEGESAGGNAKDRKFRDCDRHAVFALSGKPPNVQSMSVASIRASHVYGPLIEEIGMVPEKWDQSKMKYWKYVIMTDADVDGMHIRVLLETFFMKLWPELVVNGHLFISNPPLFILENAKGESIRYFLTEKAMFEEAYKIDPNITSADDIIKKKVFYPNVLTYCKGLGGLSAEILHSTSMREELFQPVFLRPNEIQNAMKIFESYMEKGKDTDLTKALVDRGNLPSGNAW